MLDINPKALENILNPKKTDDSVLGSIHRAIEFNPLLNTDSYKPSHYILVPDDLKYSSAYIESRGGRWNRTMFFGLQMFLIKYMMTPFTEEHIQDAAIEWAEHGVPFNVEGARYILEKYNGYWPVTIQAVPEGTIVETNNVLVQITNNDPKCAWCVGFLETALLRAVWYPTSVATNSWMCKTKIWDNLIETSDDPVNQIAFKLHDFGARGVSSLESAGIGGAGHLVNFLGTDTYEGVRYARAIYGERMAGFSIPATEHSVVCAFGPESEELGAFQHFLNKLVGKYPMGACVSDTWSIFKSVNKWHSLRDQLINSGFKLVVRPDSGNPVSISTALVARLMTKFGYTTNKKGYDVLPPYIGVIQGDGINEHSINDILNESRFQTMSGDNIGFGMGGAMLQHFDRDTLKFAMKSSAVKRGEHSDDSSKWMGIRKDPITDSGKRSKMGRLALVENERGGYNTVDAESELVFLDSLRIVYTPGRLHNVELFREIRERSNKGFIYDES